MERKFKCPICHSSSNLRLAGFIRYYTGIKKQRVYCKKCNYFFTEHERK